VAVRIQTLTQTRRSNHRASVAVLFGVIAAGVIPLAIELTRKIPGAALLDAVWGIPVAAVAGVAALMFERGARGAIARSLDRAGGASRLRAARILAVTGLCLALSSSIAIGLYEFLLYKEH
jgi:hypothetical protein